MLGLTILFRYNHLLFSLKKKDNYAEMKVA